jgi:hypothetical protein
MISQARGYCDWCPVRFDSKMNMKCYVKNLVAYDFICLYVLRTSSHSLVASEESFVSYVSAAIFPIWRPMLT